MKNQKRIIIKDPIFSCVVKKSYLFLIYIVTSFTLTQVIVIGSSKIAGAVDDLFAGNPIAPETLIPPFLILVLIGILVSYLKSFSQSMFSIAVLNDIKNVAVKKLVKLQFRYFDEKGTGSIMNKLISDVFLMEQLFSNTIPQLVVGVITIITIGIYIFSLSIKLLFVTVICYPFLLWVANVVSIKVKNLTGQRRELYDQLQETAWDTFNGMIIGRSYNLNEIMKHRIGRVIDNTLKNEYQRTKAMSTSYFLGYIIRWIPTVICYVFALHEVIQNSLSVGEMLAFAMLLDQIVRPFGDIPSYINSFREQWVSLERLSEIIKQPEEKSGTGHFVANEQVPLISFDNLQFSYDNERTIFEGLNFSIKKGEKAAFVGSSGGGKTTVFKLLCGFYSTYTGEYKLYGHDIKNWDSREARKQFALVSQNVFLFPDTIAYNVALGKDGATMEEVKQACVDANIHDFIEKLPEGYQTYVGERGVKLSGGQRQRISIARAFLNQAPILLLDEPTSAVDMETEALIQEALERISNGKTVITIAHRLSTIKNADRIFVFSNGKIAETGNHEELLLLKGVYAELYTKENQNDSLKEGEYIA